MLRQFLVVSVFALFAIAAAAAPRPSDSHPPESGTMKWGNLTVTVRQAPVGSFSEGKARVEIKDSKGKVLAALSDAIVANTAIREINGGGSPELVVNMFSGGLHCCFTNVVFTQDGGFRRLIDLPGGQIEGITAVKDLDGRGRPEIIMYDNNIWAYYDDLAFAYCPSMPLIIGWNGARYVNQTAKFPQQTLDSAKGYQADLLAALRKPRKDDNPTWREERRHSAALGYFSNMLVVGKGSEAKAWLRNHAPRETGSWLSGHESEIRKTVVAWSKTVYSPKG
ncbi:MAG TPA: hypothetical protein VGM51_02710 [Armatimonadota bacterium]|jgi:hypothetical protein